MNPSANADWTRTWIVREHGHGHGLTTATSAGMARTWSRTDCGHGRGADMDWFRTGRGRGLDTATDGWPDYGADIPRPNRDHFADAESLAS